MACVYAEWFSSFLVCNRRTAKHGFFRPSFLRPSVVLCLVAQFWDRGKLCKKKKWENAIAQKEEMDEQNNSFFSIAVSNFYFDCVQLEK